jgi:predicted small metal-binding protein
MGALIEAREKGKGGGTIMRSEVLCASLCNCRHSLRADDNEELVEVALEHMRLHHPGAPIDEERVREIISARSYDIEYVVVYAGGYVPQEEEFGLEPY